MKLRILENSLRFRLSRSEAAALSADGVLAAATQFPGGERFSFVLRRADPDAAACAVFADGEVRVSLPSAEVADWAASERVAITEEFALREGDSLRVLVEKDFQCLAPRQDEDESDLYPHPDAGARAC